MKRVKGGWVKGNKPYTNTHTCFYQHESDARGGTNDEKGEKGMGKV